MAARRRPCEATDAALLAALDPGEAAAIALALATAEAPRGHMHTATLCRAADNP